MDAALAGPPRDDAFAFAPILSGRLTIVFSAKAFGSGAKDGSSDRSRQTSAPLTRGLDALSGKTFFGVAPSNLLFEKGHSVNVQGFVRNAFTAAGGRIWANATVTAVGDGSVTVERADVGVEMTLPADAVVDMSDLVPNTGLIEGLDGIECVAVGDCAEPWNIAEAISSANLAARKI